jgi:hypothetical protein
MQKNNRYTSLLILLPLLFLGACVAAQNGFVLPTAHPPEAELGNTPPICVDCHDARSEDFNFQRYNHTAYFGESHRQEAYQNAQVCSMCHQTSFCNDCHATRVELKPSLKNQTDTIGRMPHRGDFLARHRIEGRIDPTSCFRCHGNPKSAQTCAPCHG